MVYSCLGVQHFDVEFVCSPTLMLHVDYSIIDYVSTIDFSMVSFNGREHARFLIYDSPK